jgi:hypothetical protein
MEGKLCREYNFLPSRRNVEPGTRAALLDKSVPCFPSRSGLSDAEAICIKLSFCGN